MYGAWCVSVYVMVTAVYEMNGCGELGLTWLIFSYFGQSGHNVVLEEGIMMLQLLWCGFLNW